MTIRTLLPAFRRRSLLPSRKEEEYPFVSLQEEMNRLFDGFFRRFDLAPWEGAPGGGPFVPSVDLSEDEKTVTVSVELPGMDDQDVEVLLEENRLIIKGEKKAEKEEKGRDYYHMERAYGAFQRVIPLFAGLDTEKVDATFKNGVLTVKIPKTEAAQVKGKKIPVKTG